MQLVMKLSNGIGYDTFLVHVRAVGSHGMYFVPVAVVCTVWELIWVVGFVVWNPCVSGDVGLA